MIRRKSTPSGDLNALMKHAREYAKHMMRGAGSIPPTLFADTEDGLLICVPDQMEDERAKNNFANTSRMIAVGYRATAVAMVLESRSLGQTLF